MKNGFFLSLCIFLTLLVGNALSQEESEDLRPAYKKFEEIKVERLKRIRNELVQLQSNIYLAKKKIETESDLITKIKLESELENLQKEHDEKRHLFIETATNINLHQKKLPPDESNLSKDIKDILDPLLSGIKRISERPRAIQELKGRVDSLEENLKATESAEKRLKELLKDNKQKELNKTIERSLKTVEKRKKDLKIDLEDSQFKLLKIETSDGGTLSNFSYAIFIFGTSSSVCKLHLCY
jgi:DNA repair exonuclease SbcCD ATPase subunit